jgi:hypothetical protein
MSKAANATPVVHSLQEDVVLRLAKIARSPARTLAAASSTAER